MPITICPSVNTSQLLICHLLFFFLVLFYGRPLVFWVFLCVARPVPDGLACHLIVTCSDNDTRLVEISICVHVCLYFTPYVCLLLYNEMFATKWFLHISASIVNAVWRHAFRRPTWRQWARCLKANPAVTTVRPPWPVPPVPRNRDHPVTLIMQVRVQAMASPGQQSMFYFTQFYNSYFGIVLFMILHGVY